MKKRATGAWALAWLLLSGHASLARAANPSCETALRRTIHPNAPFDPEELARAADERLPQMQRELENAFENPDPQARQAALRGAEDPESPANKNFLERVFGERTCLFTRGGPRAEAAANARTSLAMSYALTGIGWGTAIIADPKHEIPFANLAAVAIMTMVSAELRCRRYANPAATDAPLAPPSRFQRGLRAYGDYLRWSIPGVGLYVAFVVVEDKIRGRQKPWHEYAKLGVYTLVWDLAFAGVNVIALDPLYMKAFPRWKESLRNFFGPRMATLQLKNATELPGVALDVGTRLAVRTAKIHAYVSFRRNVIDPIDSGVALEKLRRILGIPLEESPEEIIEGAAKNAGG